jgi:hypothetical protein
VNRPYNRSSSVLKKKPRTRRGQSVWVEIGTASGGCPEHDTADPPRGLLDRPSKSPARGRAYKFCHADEEIPTPGKWQGRINTKAGNRQEDQPDGTRKARRVPSATPSCLTSRL